MAYTNIDVIHAKPDNLNYLKGRIDYVTNDNKTNDGRYVTSYECNPKIAHHEWETTRQTYINTTNKQSEKATAYRVIQSFKGYEVTPELANKIGYELAMKLTQGNHSFIVTTHIDTDNIHNHITWNAFSLDCKSKYKDVKKSWRVVAMLSDELCKQYDLSVIAPTNKSLSKDYGTWLAIKGLTKSLNHTDKIKQIIDEILSKPISSFEDFIKELEKNGYEVKHKNRKHIAVKGDGMKSFIRLNTIGGEYSQDKIAEQILSGRPRINKRENKVDVMLDLEKVCAGKGVGYEKWGAKFNLDQFIKTKWYMYEKGLKSYDDVKLKYDELDDRFANIQTPTREIDDKMKSIKEKQQAIINYSKAKPIYTDYKNSGYSKKFKKQNADKLSNYEQAKKIYKDLGAGGKLPSMNELKQEYAELKKEKERIQSLETYADVKYDYENLRNAKLNLELLYEIDVNQYEKNRENELEEIQKEKEVEKENERQNNNKTER